MLNKPNSPVLTPAMRVRVPVPGVWCRLFVFVALCLAVVGITIAQLGGVTAGGSLVQALARMTFVRVVCGVMGGSSPKPSTKKTN